MINHDRYNTLGLVEAHNGAFGVFFPQAPGCTAMGKTETEATNNAIEALHDWLVSASHAARAKLQSCFTHHEQEEADLAVANGARLVEFSVVLPGGT